MKPEETTIPPSDRDNGIAAIREHETGKGANQRPPVVPDDRWTPGNRKENPKSKQVSFRVTANQYQGLQTLNSKRQRHHPGETISQTVIQALRYCLRDDWGDFINSKH